MSEINSIIPDFEEKFSFNIEFQEKLLKLCLTDLNVSVNCFKYIKPHYFEGNVFPIYFRIMKTYYEKYNKLITLSAFKSELQELVKSDPQHQIFVLITGIENINSVVIEDAEYIKDKVEEFIKRSIFVPAIKDVGITWNKGRPFHLIYEKMQNIISEIDKVALKPKERSFFFDEIQDRYSERINLMLSDKQQRIATFIPTLDEKVLRGGLVRGEFAFITGDSKRGKSVFLVNVATRNAKLGNKVLYCNLEGPMTQLANRCEACVLDIPYSDVIKNEIPTHAFNFYNKLRGNLVLSQFNQFDANILDIEAEIKRLKVTGFQPDLICIDYGDLLSPLVAKKSETYQAQEETFRAMKKLADKYNCVVWTASQTNRMKDADTNNPAFLISRKNMADSYAKVRICDLHLTINMTDVEYKNKKGRLYVDAYRDAEMAQVIPYNHRYENMQFIVPAMSDWNKGAL